METPGLNPAENPCIPALQGWPIRTGLLGVACSGGADSTALLLAAQALWPGRVAALHVHHGLQAVADDFEQRVRRLCTDLGVVCAVARIDARHQPGESPEAAARKHRYLALTDLARRQGVVQVMLAQHAEDQLETMLLAWTRGAGPAGLAGMAPDFVRNGVNFVRPLLAVSGRSIRAWLASAGQTWVDDPMNSDDHYTRVKIRQLCAPWLQGFPQLLTTAARTATLMGEAVELLNEWAQIDLNQVGVPPQLVGLQGLSPARRRNLLRHWLKTYHHTIPSQAQLLALDHQVVACTTKGHQIVLRCGHGWIRREGPSISWYT